MSKDKEQIELLGGPATLARKLGYSVQRVQNWKDRGIPAKVKLDHPEIFQLHEAKFGRRATDEQMKSQPPACLVVHDQHG